MPDSTHIACPACSGPLQTDARFCARCGMPLSSLDENDVAQPTATARTAQSALDAEDVSAPSTPLPSWVERVPQSDWVSAPEFRFQRPSGWEHAAYRGEPGRPPPNTVAAVLFGPGDDGYRSNITVYRLEPCSERKFRWAAPQLAEARRKGAPVASGFTPGFHEPRPGLVVYSVAYQQPEVRYDTVVSEAWLQRPQKHKSGLDLALLLLNRFRRMWLDQNELFCIDYASTMRTHDGSLLIEILHSWAWTK